MKINKPHGSGARRYIPNADNVMALQSGDVELMKILADLRLATVSQLALIAGRSLVTSRRRLRKLMDNGYIKRYRHPENLPTVPGSKPDVYALLIKGAKVLARVYGLDVKALHYHTRASRLDNWHVLHSLLVNDVLASAQAASRSEAGIDYLAKEEVLGLVTDEVREEKRPFCWQLQFDDSLKIGVEPDAVFAFKNLKISSRKNEVFCFLEADRGTEAVSPKSLYKASPKKKMLAYALTHAEKLHQTRFNMNNFLVLFITNSEIRKETMLATLNKLWRKKEIAIPNAFLFTTEAELLKAESFFDLQWSRLSGDISLREVLLS